MRQFVGDMQRASVPSWLRAAIDALNAVGKI
jgi:hypothetical protein